MCSPVTSFASLAERRSQKRSVPSKWPLTAMVPSMVRRTALTEEGWRKVLTWKPLLRSQTCRRQCLSMRTNAAAWARNPVQGDSCTINSVIACPNRLSIKSTILSTAGRARNDMLAAKCSAARQYLS